MADDYYDYFGGFIPRKSTVEPSKIIPFPKIYGTQELYNVILVIGGIVERAHIFIEYKSAHKKFLDFCGEFCVDFHEFSPMEVETVVKIGHIKFHNGSVNILKVRVSD